MKLIYKLGFKKRFLHHSSLSHQDIVIAFKIYIIQILRIVLKVFQIVK